MVKRIVLVAAALACADPTIPSRQAAYPFDDGLGEVFRWPAGRLPVRYYADARGAMAALVRQGLAAWEDQFLYGEFDGVLASNAMLSDKDRDAPTLSAWARDDRSQHFVYGRS